MICKLTELGRLILELVSYPEEILVVLSHLQWHQNGCLKLTCDLIVQHSIEVKFDSGEFLL